MKNSDFVTASAVFVRFYLQWPLESSCPIPLSAAAEDWPGSASRSSVT